MILPSPIREDMEYSDSSHGSEPDPLHSWLSDEDLSLIGELGQPDPYHWGNLQDWTEKLLRKYHGRISDSRTVRQRFIRTRCVACRRLCEDPDMESIIDPPVALPCGHIMGWTCYADFCDNFTCGEGALICPWNGPSDDEPAEWSQACNERIVYSCSHTGMLARIPAPNQEFYLPPEFFTPPGGFVTSNCRRCTVKEFLATWTHEARQEEAYPNVFASCGGIHGLQDGERRLGFRLQSVPGLERLAEERSRFLGDLFATTSTPATNGVAEEMSSNVLFLEPVVE